MEYHRDQLILLVYVNDMTEGVNSYLSLLENNAKLLRKIRNHKDCEELQNDINKIYEWSKTWEMEFDAKQCHVLEMGKSAMRPSWMYKFEQNIISIIKEEKDLRVVIQDKLSPEKHIDRIFGDTFRMLRIIRMFLMRKIIITMIRPKLKYAEVIWSPHKKKHVLKFDR